MSSFLSLFLILVIVVLLGVIAWSAWMFLTGRWVTARSVAAMAFPIENGKTEASYSSNSPMTNSPYISEPGSRSVHVPPAEELSDRETRSPSQDLVDPLDNKRWMKLVEGCVNLFDELDGLFPVSDPRHETAEHVMYRLREILSRSGVEIISQDRAFDENRHLADPPNYDIPPGTPISEVISPGFAVGRRVLRQARVRIAHSFPPSIEQAK
ncbi:MAG TPA: nucleotide exchange factor GrpE [Ktedonobacteraceae bacterium]|nr:nucleotide exchange factor GrpE [Ktedonobacteraceae bacterium]